jgi:competence protein ComEC
VLLPFGMPLLTAYFWSKAPFTRLLFALTAGIILQWQVQFSFYLLFILFSIFFLSLLLYFLVPVRLKYKYGYLNGITINLLIIITGALLVWFHDTRNIKDWIGNSSTDDNYKVVTIEEPLVEKTNSFKALASINGVYSKNNFESLKGEVVVYFKKDSVLKQLHYGSQIIFKKPLQQIKNAGNPGGFDYKQYSLFQGITHQINLSQKEFEILPTEKQNWFHSFIFSCRRWVVSTLQKFIVREKEHGLAEALLIGYKDDLDKNLVQSYTNTGVVHIIAISGMHLALIYGLLLLLTKPLRRKHLQFLRVNLIL